MSVSYDGSHSVTFISGESNSLYEVRRSWIDFHLIPDEVPFVAEREPGYMVVDVPFASKSYDYTNLIGKGLHFDSAKGEWTFYVDHDKWSSWYEAKASIENYINGKRLYCVLEDDHSYAYGGRFIVNNWEDEEDYSKITIGYEIDEYRVANSFNYTL